MGQRSSLLVTSYGGGGGDWLLDGFAWFLFLAESFLLVLGRKKAS